MTSAQIATALRPFYFVVHPDLFGKLYAIVTFIIRLFLFEDHLITRVAFKSKFVVVKLATINTTKQFLFITEIFKFIFMDLGRHPDERVTFSIFTLTFTNFFPNFSR